MSKSKKLITFIVCIICLLIYLQYENKALEITTIEVEDSKIPKSFDNFSIIQISDLHDAEFGKNQKNLIEKVKEIDPDIIVITGDFIDFSRYNIENSSNFIYGVSDSYKVYYVPGNHEAALKSRYEEVQDNLQKAGATVLDNENYKICKDNECINLIGVQDISFIENKDKNILKNTISELKNESLYNILLSHRPNLWETYEKAGMDLVLSGHAHGGQIRLPFNNGLYAPDQGVFPQYTSGANKFGNTLVVISRGLGNSRFPFRVNNRPEIVNIILHSS